MFTEKKNRKLVQRLVSEGWNEGRLAIIEEACSPHTKLVLPGDRHVGRDWLKDLIRQYRAAFPDLHVAVLGIFAVDDEVIVRWVATGTHRGPLGGAYPTGNRVRLEGVTTDRFEKGLIVEQQYYWDQLSLLQQVGALPEESRVA